ncbi:glutaredoxin family protein [Streptomyces mirabilis]|uniref:glutaredoxin family protein n=1 Tax=Streptomyces mirabilis TaxID=68239 RepID=UPI0036AB611B
MIALTLLTRADCAWCERAKKLLADFEAEVTEVSLDTDGGRELAARHRLLFAPGLLYSDRLIAYGRLSARALRRELSRLSQT